MSLLGIFPESGSRALPLFTVPVGLFRIGDNRLVGDDAIGESVIKNDGGPCCCDFSGRLTSFGGNCGESFVDVRGGCC